MVGCEVREELVRQYSNAAENLVPLSSRWRRGDSAATSLHPIAGRDPGWSSVAPLFASTLKTARNLLESWDGHSPVGPLTLKCVASTQEESDRSLGSGRILASTPGFLWKPGAQG